MWPAVGRKDREGSVKSTPPTAWLAWAAVGCALLTLGGPASAFAAAHRDDGRIIGRVVSAVDQGPLKGYTVVALGHPVRCTTDQEGDFSLNLPPGSHRLRIFAPDGDFVDMAHQVVETGRITRISISFIPKEVPRDARVVPGGMGFPPVRGRPEPSPGPVSIAPVAPPGRRYLTIPKNLPPTIKVGIFPEVTNCRGSAQAIATVGFEDYVKGVVYAEVGVFRGAKPQSAGFPSGDKAANEVWKVFSLAARSYGLWYHIYYDGKAAYHINNTACNQVYGGGRYPGVSAAVDATRGQILVNKSKPTELDKYFYAAACNHWGTLPHFSKVVVPDPTKVLACVGTWCGHVACRGHAVNPSHPNGKDGYTRCLVWGICQWGALERSMAGESYKQILAHYQPNLSIVTLGTGTQPKASIVGVVREDSIHNGKNIVGAKVTLSGPGGTRKTTTDAKATFRFGNLETGSYSLTVVATGYCTETGKRDVIATGGDHWRSFAMKRCAPPKEKPPTPEPVQKEKPVVDSGVVKDRGPGVDRGPVGGDPKDPREILVLDGGSDDEESATEMDEKGGCGCAAGADGQGPAVVLLSLLLMAILRRARRPAPVVRAGR